MCLSHKPPGMLVQGPHFEKDCSRTSFGSGSGSTTASPSYPSERLRLLSLQGQCLVFFFFFFFLAALGLHLCAWTSLGVTGGGYSPALRVGFSLQWLLWL